MSCCGEPKDLSATNRPQPFPAAPVNTQPGFNPMMQQPQAFQQPSIPSPPLAHTTNGFSTNTFQQQTQQQTGWSQSPSPPPPTNDFAQLSQQMTGGAVNPTLNGSTYNGSSFNVNNGFSSINQPLMRPGSAHSPHMSISTPPLSTSPPLGMPQNTTQIQDEGKMSISIDFGKYVLYAHETRMLTIFFPRYYFLWCGTS